MAEVFQLDKIAAGANNTAGLTNVEELADSTGRRFCAVDDMGKFSDGQDTLRGDGLTVPQGYASFSWASGFMTLEGWYYLFNTINAGKRSNFVTVATRKFNPASYANYNAVLSLPPPPSEQKGVNEYRPFIWRFTRVVVIP